MPPPLPSQHRGMTANPLKPVRRYRPGKAIAEEPSSSEEDEEVEDEQVKEQERRRQEQQQRLKQRAAPKASSFPAGGAAAGKITKGVRDVRIEPEEDEDEEGFVTEEEEEENEPTKPSKVAPHVAGDRVEAPARTVSKDEVEEEEEEESEEEESSEEESSSEDEAPRRVLLRPTFIKKGQRNNAAGQGQNQGHETQGKSTQTAAADSAAEAEARRAQRQEKANMLIREQLEKDAIARSAANKAWDDDEQEAAEEGAIDDRDGVDPEAEYAAWKLRELKRIKREREAIEAAEKEREEVERRRNLTAEEREREDREYIAKQKEEKEASRGETGYMKRYFHKGAFFRDDLEREGLDKRDIMGSRFVDEVSRETLPQYMQIRDMTKLGKKGRTRYKDLKSEDTGRFGEGFDNRRRRNDVPTGITDERFLPDRGDDRPRGPTGANASAVRERRRSYSPQRDRRDRSEGDRGDSYRPDNGSRRKRSPSPYEDREKRRRTEEVS
ncbi:splicing factor, Prp19-binding domain-containing protein [Aspergillus ambiguus]|uniref:splicing factor, Prp19-binding domain-containing protein n=1 Tax=Aspergillus ambiguus TaxID=176160 RepID=UPI003CCC9603